MSQFLLKSADGTELTASVLSKPKEPVAVMTLVHGFGEHHKRYQHMADYLNGFDVAVIAADLRGHGLSDGKRGCVKKYDELGQDLEALLAETRQRFTGVPHILYGHSMGGGLVLNRLTSDPSIGHDLYGVIASAPLLKLVDAPNAILRCAVNILCLFAPQLNLKNPIDGTMISTIKVEQDAYVDDPLNHGEMSLGLAKGMVEAGEAALQHASALEAPLMLLHSKGDRLTSFSASQDFAARAQNCSFHGFASVEHEMHNDTSRDAVYVLVKDFILNQVQSVKV